MNRSSTVAISMLTNDLISVIQEPPRQRHDELKPLKLVGVSLLDCGRGLNRSSTVAESGSFIVVLQVY